MSIPTFGTSAFVVGPFSYDSESGWDSTYHLPKRSRCTKCWATVAGGKYCSCLTWFKLYNLIFFLHKFKILKGIFFKCIIVWWYSWIKICTKKSNKYYIKSKIEKAQSVICDVMKVGMGGEVGKDTPKKEIDFLWRHTWQIELSRKIIKVKNINTKIEALCLFNLFVHH